MAMKRDFNNEPDTNKVGLMDGGFAAVYRIDALLTKSHELFINSSDPRNPEALQSLFDCINGFFDEIGNKLDLADRDEIEKQLDSLNLASLYQSKNSKIAAYNFNKIKTQLRKIRQRLMWLADNKGLLIPNLKKKKSFIGDME